MKMFWICEFLDSLTAKDGARHIAAREKKFLMFKRKKDAKKYLYEVLNHSDEYIRDCVCFEKISLEEAKKLFGNYKYEII